MFPLRDENPTRTKPFITWTIIIITVLVFIWQFQNNMNEEIIYNYGEIPILILKGEKLYTLITSIFLHGSILHIFGNMLYLFVFGDNVEDRFGHFKFLILYFLFGIAGSLTHSIIAYTSDSTDLLIPAIGASGAISGILGAYIVLFPKARIISIVPSYFFIRIARIPAIFFIGFWFILQFLYGVLSVTTGVAYWAHIGGFISGFIIAIFYRLIYK
ncbi:MAG: rhomboid family intramembrane serine protease [Nitrososphaerota archaeon]